MEFHAGRAADGRQILLGLLCPEVIAFFFDAAGLDIGKQQRPWRTPAPRMGADGPYRIHDATFVAEVTRQIEDWKRELGFEEGLISVRAFFDDELWVGVEAVPDHLDDDVDETAEERRERQESRQKWIEAGQDSSSSGGPRPVR